MIRALKALLGLALREDATTAELTPSLPAAEAEFAAARAALDAAEAAFRSGLLTVDEAALAQLDAERDQAGRRVKRAEALVAALRERLAEARDREAEAERVAAYQAAAAQADDARQALAEWFPRLAHDMVQLIEVVARAEIEVQAANADLPRGVEPLASVEHTARDVPAEPDDVVSEVEVQRWVAVGQIKPGSFDQGNIYVTGPGRGVIRTAGLPVNEGRQVELRRFIERRVRKGAAHRIAYNLFNRIALPGFRPGDPEFWRPLASGTRPDEVVRHIEALRYYQPEPEAASSRPIVTELIPAPGAERVKELAASPATIPYRGPYGSADTATA